MAMINYINRHCERSEAIQSHLPRSLDCFVASLLAMTVGWGCATANAQVADLVPRTTLRVCADPSDLPFSNDRKEGFENRIADVIAQDLGVPVAYVWFPRIGAFARQTLQKRQCDLVMGTVAGDDEMDTTTPYYHSGYMIVSRADAGIKATTLGDPSLADKRIGLIASTPPTDLLIRHDLMAHVTSYSLSVDSRFESPARQMVQDIIDRKIDIGLLWGPIAGYYVTHEHLPLTAEFLTPEPDSARLDYHISMGLRAGEPDWRRRINQAIQKQQPQIAAILAEYGVPLLDEENHAVAAGTPPIQ
jgi:quinoprotein dehydrogenase-associated probable ABC transporter substrate-binding protein